jgi:hypothetical protein
MGITLFCSKRDKTAGAILQPQPPPWLNSVKRTGVKGGKESDIYNQKQQ